MNHAAARLADLPSGLSNGSVRPARPLGRFTRASMILAVCAALGMGLLAGQHASLLHHTVSSVSLPTLAQSASTPAGISGGPGNS
jgi:hypothetical protein